MAESEEEEEEEEEEYHVLTTHRSISWSLLAGLEESHMTIYGHGLGLSRQASMSFLKAVV